MNNSDGVSPVIGVIIMVAITVFLAAVISVVLSWGVVEQPKPDQMVYNKTITIAEFQRTIDVLHIGVIDTDGNGYLIALGAKGSGAKVGGIYTVKYFINSDDERVIYFISVPEPTPEPTPVSTLNPYKCINGPYGCL